MYIEEQDFAAKKIDWNVWKHLYRYALQHKKLFFTVIAALVAVAAIDISYPLFTSYAIDHFVVPKSLAGLGKFAMLYLSVILVQSSGVITFITFAGKLEMAIAYNIRQDGFLRLQELSFSYYDKTAVGYIMARMMSDISRLSDMIAWSLVDVLWSLLYAIGCIITMFVLSWKLALISLAVLPLLAFISIKLQKLMLKYQRESRKLNSKPADRIHWRADGGHAGCVYLLLHADLRPDSAACEHPRGNAWFASVCGARDYTA